MKRFDVRYAWWLVVASLVEPSVGYSQSRYATSDNMKGYVHWIELYDDNNQRIDPAENPRPYSPEKTCGRCHDFKTISHGWHFNAGLVSGHGEAGRPGQPLLWNDPRTGTHLPLSYRGWKGAFKPSDLGITNWQIAAKLGGYLPGVAADTPQGVASQSQDQTLTEAEKGASVDRSHLTGVLPVDCMLCHHRPGSGYSPFVWTEQIEEQNFAYAPTAALGLAVVTGNMRRLKDDFDIRSPDTLDQLPKVQYESSRFRSDGKVFVDVVRRPTNDACYYCHTELSSQAPNGSRWMHDQDVHLRAGMLCVDCHHNGLDHQTVRGFEAEQHPVGSLAAVWSCQGCHIDVAGASSIDRQAILASASVLPESGRLGAPLPAHRGIPPLHFEKMSCTACHSGESLGQEVPRQILSIGHDLGHHIKRTGAELPAIFGNVNLPVNAQGGISPDAQDGKYTPHRLMWPSFWGYIRDGQVQPVHPELAYELLRKPLKVRRDFLAELSEVKLSLAKRREILGDDRAARAKPEELSEEQRQKIESAEIVERDRQVTERISAALAELEAAFPGTQAVLVSGGSGFVRGPEGQLDELPSSQLGDAAQPYAWPAAHAVRPARQALGATGCQECHGQEANFFFSKIQPVGVVPGQEIQPVVAHQLQQADVERLTAWSQLFEGRPWFKIFGWSSLGLTGLVVLSALAINLSDLWRRKPTGDA
jgi:hypothetical protein